MAATGCFGSPASGPPKKPVCVRRDRPAGRRARLAWGQPNNKGDYNDTDQRKTRQRSGIHRLPRSRPAQRTVDRVGAAWSHKDNEGFSLKIELIPLDVLKTGELNIQLRAPDPKDEAGDASEPNLDGGE
jgi:hypothetical protein